MTYTIKINEVRNHLELIINNETLGAFKDTDTGWKYANHLLGLYAGYLFNYTIEG